MDLVMLIFTNLSLIPKQICSHNRYLPEMQTFREGRVLPMFLMITGNFRELSFALMTY